MKLVRVYCYLRDNDGDDGDDLEAVEKAHEDELVSGQWLAKWKFAIILKFTNVLSLVFYPSISDIVMINYSYNYGILYLL